MNKELLINTILSPHTSEKSTRLADKHRQFVFKVMKDATKKDIKHAVELLFKVVVDSVCICNMKGKSKTFKQTRGQRSSWKKAYVSLAEGHDIKFAVE